MSTIFHMKPHSCYFFFFSTVYLTPQSLEAKNYSSFDPAAQEEIHSQRQWPVLFSIRAIYSDGVVPPSAFSIYTQTRGTFMLGIDLDLGTEAFNVYLELHLGRRVVLKEISLGSIRVTRKNFPDLWAKGWWVKHHRVAA